MKPLKKKIVVITLILLSFAALTNAETIYINNRQYDKIDGQWYQIENDYQYEVNNSVITVKFHDNVTQTQIDSVNIAHGCNVIKFNILEYYDLAIPKNSDPLEVVQDYLDSELTEIAEPNNFGEFSSVPDDPNYDDQWHHHAEPIEFGIESYKAWDIETGDPSVIIGILDSGTEVLHEDLEGNIWVNPGEDLDEDGVVWDMDDINNIDDDENGYIDDLVGWDFFNHDNDVDGRYWHGTHVAGVAGAVTNNDTGISGVAGGWGEENPGCSMQISVVGDPSFSSETITEAILYAAMNGARIITLSLRIGETTAMKEAIETAYDDYGCFVDCCSHNQNYDYLPFPANFEFVFAVGGSNQYGLKYNLSNYGEGLMVVAPAVDIYSTLLSNTYGYKDGTSMAAPQVAGVAGLIASIYPEFTNIDIESVICLTAEKLSYYTFDEDKEYGTWNNYVGYGKLNAERALGISGIISSSITLNEGNYIFGEEVTVTNNATLTLADNSRIYLLEGAELIIENGANIVIGDNVLFSTPESQTSGILRINGSDPVVCNDLQFYNCDLYTNNTELEILGGNFTNSYIEHLNETLILDDIDFDQSHIFAEKRLIPSLQFYVDIQNCSIQNSDTYGVWISLYPSFTVRNNNISNNDGAALHLYSNTDGCIENNDFNFNGVGININNTETEIITYNEIIENGGYGIVAVNNSNWSLVGVNDSPCQIIANNNDDDAEIYFTNTSLPDDVTYNKIYDSDFNSEFIHCYGIPLTVIDVEDNFWGAAIGGNSRIPASDNLTPFASYDFTPVWNPGVPRGGEEGDAELLYLSGKDLEVDEYYVAAEQTYKDVISLYPASNYSKMAAKQLMSITEKTNQDYFTLKNYYDTEPNMTYDEEMIKVSSFLSNQCNIKITEFPTAIDWFEDVISDPPSQIDSVLAVIDLGHTYLLMEENGDRSNYVGKFPNLKPDSWEEYEENTIQLLNDLFGEPEIKPDEEPFIDIIPASVILHRNYPNPFNPTTLISFSIHEESNVELTIFNIKGQKVKTLINSNLDQGTHSVVWNGEDELNVPVSTGIYFYKLNVNGKTEGTKKMLLLK